MDGQSTYPWFKRGIKGADGASTAAHLVPTLSRRQGEDPRAYIPHEDLSHAVNVALALGMPLLLTGEPGTGKTQLAHTVAAELQCALYKFETKSTSVARDLFYTYDALTAFKMKDVTDPRAFMRYQALGRAILEAFPANHPRVQALLPPAEQSDFKHPGEPRRSVVLIDEIDKAPRDFPNDLLNEIDRLTFRVTELRNLGSPGADPGEEGVPDKFRPIVILTSNSEKGLPDPFLRRCVYFDIPFPDREQMASIVAARVTGMGGSLLLTDALDLFYKLRHAEGQTRLNKEPSTAELLNWLQLLLHRGARPDQSLRNRADLVTETLTTLVKTQTDRTQALEYIKDRWAARGTGDIGG